jgi:hypothetical protein
MTARQPRLGNLLAMRAEILAKVDKYLRVFLFNTKSRNCKSI